MKASFFKCRRFHDRADLEAQLAQGLGSVSTERPSRATRVLPPARLADERLRPLPLAPAAHALKFPVVVSAQARVRHGRAEYSMPVDILGQTATLRLYEEHLDIVTKTGAGRAPSAASARRQHLAGASCRAARTRPRRPRAALLPAAQSLGTRSRRRGG